MSETMVKTRYPGIYRRGKRYVIRYRADGRHRTESARTLDEARLLLARRQREVRDGSFQEQSRQLLADYARAWVATYQGRGRGFRERTRTEYARDLERYVIPFLGNKQVSQIRRSDIRAWIAWLVDEDAQRRRHDQENKARAAAGKRALPGTGQLRDRTVARIVAVLSACLSTAMLDELRRDNPVSHAVIPRRDALPEAGDDAAIRPQAKAFTRAQLATVIANAPPEWRVLFRFLAATGLRISEALALDRKHLRLDDDQPVVRVRRALSVRSARDTAVTIFDRPKSEYGGRDIPLPPALVYELRHHLAGQPKPPADTAREWGRLVFPSAAGTPMSQTNLNRRALAPAVEAAGASWAAFHAFRHTFASLHIERGTNIVRLSRLLGHHKPSFTLDVYSHMLDLGYGDPLDLDAELAKSENKSENIEDGNRPDHTGGGD